MANNILKIKEIFYSLQGESSFVGIPTTFIRLTGCPLRCVYCDTEYAFHGGNNLSFSEIISQIQQHPTKYICITGGEPLAQKACFALISELLDNNYIVSIETSGAIDIAQIDTRAITIMDLKTPDSGEEQRNLWQNLKYLKPNDQVKFVICSKNDYEWSKSIINNNSELRNLECLFSPCFGKISPTELADWIIADGLQVRMQIQLHKILWGDEPGK